MLYSFKSVSNLRHFMCHLHRSTPTWHILLQKYKNKLVKHEKKMCENRNVFQNYVFVLTKASMYMNLVINTFVNMKLRI